MVETLHEENVARISLYPLTSSGELRQPDGKRYPFSFKGSFRWTDTNGIVLARIEGGDGNDGSGTVTETAATGKSLPLLLVFAGWYLQLSLKRERAGGSLPRETGSLIRKPVGAV